MKKTINGTTYNTKKAQALCERIEGQIDDRADLNRLAEILYRAEDGEFFLWGIGGSNTSYKNLEKITPMRDWEAKEWVMRNFPVDEYEKIFG